MSSSVIDSAQKQKGFRAVHVVWIILATIVVTVALTWWGLRTYIYAKDFKPVELNVKETQQLNGKLRLLGYQPEAAESAAPESDEKWLRSEAYTEAGGKREVRFSERELNALLASDKQLARRLAIDLSNDLVSARLLVPVDPDFPLLGGKTLRVSAGVEMSYNTARPMVKLKGVTVMGVPIPNAWLGGLKNVDLIGQFGDDQGFWTGFSQGVEDIKVEDGALMIRLKE